MDADLPDFQDIHDEFRPKILRYLRRMVGDTDAEDVCQEVFVKVDRALPGSVRTELTRDEVARTLVDGFFPEAAADARPAGRSRGALTRLGLPYAQDPAVTRHLAAFLGMQTGATDDLPGFAARGGSFLHPTAVLFNGGVFKAGALVERVLKVIDAWIAADGAPPVRVLAGADLDLSVARGAAYYGYVRRGGGVRIRGGTARAYYVGVESAMPAVPGLEPPIQALCLAPFARGRRAGDGGRARVLP